VTRVFAVSEDWSTAVREYPFFGVVVGIWTETVNDPVESVVAVVVIVTVLDVETREKETTLFAAKPVPFNVTIAPGATFR
jgi:hypothetical protein